MRYWTIGLILALSILPITGCGYHLGRINTQVPTKTITLSSYDPYGKLTRAIRTELRLNNVILVDKVDDKNTAWPSLKIVNSSENQATTSIFQDGKIAEYQITLSVQAQILMPSKDYYPINIKVYRSFFNNQKTALAKDSEIDIIRQELRRQAAQQLIRKLLTMHLPTNR